MPIRTVKQHSDRGSIKELGTGDNEPATPFELRLKHMYEYAVASRDEAMQASLGFIVMNNPGDRSAYPVNLYRHREYIKSLNAKLADEINKTAQEIELCLSTSYHEKQIQDVFAYHAKRAHDVILDNTIVKTASPDVYVSPTRSFRRVR